MSRRQTRPPASSLDASRLGAATGQAFARIPELRDAAAPLGTVRVAPGRDVPLSRRVAAVVDHPAFQRLRWVRQLGPTHLLYPGATHVRFEHSLGAYGYVRAFLRALLETPSFADTADEASLLTVLAAGLLHDIGHYPFAHSLEAIHHKDAGSSTPRHEELAGRVIRGEIASVQRGEKPIAHLLRWEWGIDPERVISLITAKRHELPTSLDRVLQSIISGAIDADKMDYLERDTVHLGVPYGTTYDRDRLLGALTLNRAEDAIAVWAKGKLSAEIFIFSRYTMFSEVYWHHTVRSASAMVEGALADYVRRATPEPAELTEQLLTRSDDDLLSWFRAAAPKGSTADRLLQGLTGGRRRLYKRVVTYSRAYAEPEKRAVYERLYRATAAETYEMTQRLRQRFESVVNHHLPPSAVIIDVPPRDKDQLEPFAVRFPAVSGQDEYPLHELSGIVSGVRHDMIQVVKKIRIFCDPTTAAELRGMRERVEEVCQEEVLRP